MTLAAKINKAFSSASMFNSSPRNAFQKSSFSKKYHLLLTATIQTLIITPQNI